MELLMAATTLMELPLPVPATILDGKTMDCDGGGTMIAPIDLEV